MKTDSDTGNQSWSEGREGRGERVDKIGEGTKRLNLQFYNKQITGIQYTTEGISSTKCNNFVWGQMVTRLIVVSLS